MKITLSKRKLAGGKLSLSIEFYRGSEISEDGKRKHLRTFENIDTFIFENPKTAAEKKHK